MSPEKSVFALIRTLVPRAPRIGSEQYIYLGVAKDDGRYQHTIVRGPDDVPRLCRVTSYAVKTDGNRVDVLVTVRMNSPVKCFIERQVTAHVSCMKCVRIGTADQF